MKNLTSKPTYQLVNKDTNYSISKEYKTLAIVKKIQKEYSVLNTEIRKTDYSDLGNIITVVNVKLYRFDQLSKKAKLKAIAERRQYFWNDSNEQDKNIPEDQRDHFDYRDENTWATVEVIDVIEVREYLFLKNGEIVNPNK